MISVNYVVLLILSLVTPISHGLEVYIFISESVLGIYAMNNIFHLICAYVALVRG